MQIIFFCNESQTSSFSFANFCHIRGKESKNEKVKKINDRHYFKH